MNTHKYASFEEYKSWNPWTMYTKKSGEWECKGGENKDGNYIKEMNENSKHTKIPWA